MLENFQNIRETLKNVVAEYGEGILLDTYKLSAVLCDAAPNEKKARMLLMLALDEGIGKYYVDAGNMPKERIISRTLDSLNASFSKDRIQDITAVLFYALGWDTAIVTVYFDEYKKRMAHTEQGSCDASPEKIQAELRDGLTGKEEAAAEEADMRDDREVTSRDPIDLQEQVRRLKKHVSILLVIIALILLGILIFSILAWRNTRASVPDADTEQAFTPDADMLQFDLNEDGAVDSTDAAVILGISAKMGVDSESALDESLLEHADVNGDSSVDASDAACVLQYAAYAGSGNIEK